MQANDNVCGDHKQLMQELSATPYDNPKARLGTLHSYSSKAQDI